ncbi:autotransporter assembly complex protein TamA [Xylophilus sp.]|uniref:autotransporter assembly complex protein TamA n=1 Tax=Xylophilus sp. TaxID=2653893 RepID=UPI0013BDFA0C|nr:autotransporter assembly complex family protein [Xylophilus sp.]KAF1048540.1 MAG: Translocation and assembly module subunit TamA [Xylophilus sp.]
MPWPFSATEHPSTRSPFAPARVPALAFLVCTAALLALPGCGLLRPDKTAEGEPEDHQLLTSEQAAQRADKEKSDEAKDGDGRTKAPSRRDAFTVDVKAPPDIADYLRRHLELQRYRTLDDLQSSELSRLLGAAEGNARELLGTLGYFAPRISVLLNETPTSEKAPREVVVAVDPGTPTTVSGVQIGFSGATNDLPTDASRQRAIRDGWSLAPGARFTQDAWDGAKTQGLRALTARRYPTARIADSRADVDADAARPNLSVDYDSGPAYRFGPMQVRGAERYPPEVAERLARLPVGSDYDQAQLLDAQQRLASSGYYDSVFLTLDTEAGVDPAAAPVIAQVRDAKLQKVVFGVGVSTDSGPRVSVDHTHNQLPLIGWRALSKLSIDRETQVIGSEQNSLPDEDQWRWVTSEQLKRESTGNYDVDSARLRGGRSKNTDHISRSYYLQYDRATSEGSDAPPSAAALSVNYAWTGRYFDNNAAPTRGWGLSVEAGPGYTLMGERKPFVRVDARTLGYIPFGTVVPETGAPRRARLQLRGELGAVLASHNAGIPSPLMFLTGGDTTVRGYSYRQIGARTVNNLIYAGRYMAVASVEWQRPIVWHGEMTDFESAVFVDAGAVSDKASDLQIKTGVGAGVRWRSPVGPLQADLAYGVDPKKLRLHLRLGFIF